MRKIRNEELHRKTTEEFKKAEKRSLVLVLDDVRSLNNIGSVFRTADAFLCSSVYLCGITAQPPHREIHKTALGAEETVDWKYFEKITTALDQLKTDGYTIIAVEQVEGGISLLEFKPEPTKKYAFVFGHEVNGVSEEAISMCDMAIEIPQDGSKHSLNISVCVGVVVWDVVSKI